MTEAELQPILVQGFQHHQAGRLAQAEQSYRQILSHDPNHANALHLFGVLAHQVGRHDVAAELIARAVALRPAAAEFHSNLGLALQGLGKLDQAAHAFATAITLKPEFATAHNNLGGIFKSQGRLESAMEAFKRALQLNPAYAEAQNNIGNVLQAQGKIAEAESAYRAALLLAPNNHVTLNNLGNVLRLLGRLPEAEATLQAALRINPKFPEAFNNLGVVLLEQARLDDAAAAFRQSLQLKPNAPEALVNLGNAAKALGEHDQAIAAYRAALQLKPDAREALSNLIYILHFHPGYDAKAIYEESCRWDQLHGKPLASAIQPHLNDRSPDRPLRIGYVSSNFCQHPVGHNFLPLAIAHDRRQFHFICYSTGRSTDAMNRRFRELAGEWRDIRGMPTEAVAQLVRRDQIDILVDLTMHMDEDNLLLFAHKPAPLQVASLCSMGTTGLSTIDYRISDRYSDPPDFNDAFYTEKTIRLPDCYFCHEPPGEDPPVGPVPSLTTGQITFGSLNNFCKITPQVLDTWAKILAPLPTSRLLLRCPPGSAQQKVLARFASHGIASHRIEFSARMPGWENYLREHNRIDIYLDPFPYSGHTTSLDALWMGVPLITLAGTRDVGRSGVFILNNLNLPELIAPTLDQYIQKAITLAQDSPRLTHLRTTLRPRLKESPLMNITRYTQNVESAYRQIWQTWCAK